MPRKQLELTEDARYALHTPEEKIRFLVDENVHAGVARFLGSHGWNVKSVDDVAFLMLLTSAATQAQTSPDLSDATVTVKNAQSTHFINNTRRAGTYIWELGFFDDHKNLLSGNYREW